MAGLFGLFDKRSVENRERGERVDSPCQLLAAMTAAMQYESRYVQRQHICQELGSYVGWTGPAVRSHHAVLDRRDGLSLLVSGEPLCEPADGRTEGDQCLNILSAYQGAGERFVRGISGSFSGVLLDKKARRWFLFNDRFGAERIFLYENDAYLAFSTEAKAILAAFPETRGFDQIGVAQFIASGCTFDAHSLYRGVQVMPGGSIVQFAAGKKPTAGRYAFSGESREPITEQDYVARFSDRLTTVVGTYLGLYSHAGVSLTGGLDTRMIMASLSARDEMILCYTFGSMYRETFDVRTARRIARLCRQPYTVLVLGQDFLSSFGFYLRKAVVASDGYLGFSGASELYLNALASDQAPLRITGNYGGELLRGAASFECSSPDGDFLRPGMSRLVEEAVSDFADERLTTPATSLLALHAAARFGRYAIERSQVSQATPFLDNELVEMACATTDQPGRIDPSVQVIRRCRPQLLSIPTDRGLLGGGGYLGRAGRRLYREALFKLEYWTGQGFPNWLAKAPAGSLAALSEHAFAGRHKFQHFRTWLRGELAGEIQNVLDATSSSPLDEYFDFESVRQMMDDHANGRRNYADALDRVTTLVLAQNLLLNGGSSRLGLERKAPTQLTNV